MPTKKKYTKQEATLIRALLREKARAVRNEQKGIRAKLRRLGFYITDFDQSYSGFTVGDFEALIKKGMIIIVSPNSRVSN